ncbi:MAG: hypothetical protein J6X75_03590 [Clostridia bacterium]|nr:hypothetical protein [Clostridia bacterium]
MNRDVLRRVFAWIALVAALFATVAIILFFFNLTGELASLFATLALIFSSIVAVFFILAKYVFAEKPEDETMPDLEEEPGSEEGDETLEQSEPEQSDEN